MKHAVLLLAVTALALGAPPAGSAQDAVKAAPKNYKVVYENDDLRVLQVTYGAGEKSPMHEHPGGLSIALTDRKERLTGPRGGSREVTAKAGELNMSGGPHSVENIGDKPFEVLVIEFKSQGAQKAVVASFEGLFKQRLGANESSALAYMRTINTAQVTFAHTYGKGFTDGLNRLGPPPKEQKPNENRGDFVAPWLAGLTDGGTNTTVTRNFYRITYTPGPGAFGSIKGYTLVAQPVQYGLTGTRSFYTDEWAIIRATSENRAATAQDPPL